MVRDLSQDGRWPEYAEVVSAQGLSAVLAVPLRLGDQRVGAVDLYDVEPRSWSADDLAGATLLSKMVTAYVLRADAIERIEQVNRQLQLALDSRVVIEQAKGKLAGELRISVDQAFRVIRDHARSNHLTVRGVSEAIVGGTLTLDVDERATG